MGCFTTLDLGFRSLQNANETIVHSKHMEPTGIRIRGRVGAVYNFLESHPRMKQDLKDG